MTLEEIEALVAIAYGGDRGRMIGDFLANASYPALCRLDRLEVLDSDPLIHQYVVALYRHNSICPITGMGRCVRAKRASHQE